LTLSERGGEKKQPSRRKTARRPKVRTAPPSYSECFLKDEPVKAPASVAFVVELLLLFKFCMFEITGWRMNRGAI